MPRKLISGLVSALFVIASFVSLSPIVTISYKEITRGAYEQPELRDLRKVMKEEGYDFWRNEYGHDIGGYDFLGPIYNGRRLLPDEVAERIFNNPFYNNKGWLKTDQKRWGDVRVLPQSWDWHGNPVPHMYSVWVRPTNQ